MDKPNLTVINAIDAITILIVGLNFQISMHADTVKQLGGIAGQSSSAAGIGRFCYGIVIER